MNFPRFFMDNDNLGDIETVGWMNSPLVKPGVKTFTHLSLHLPENSPVWEVDRLISTHWNSMGRLIAVTQVHIMQ